MTTTSVAWALPPVVVRGHLGDFDAPLSKGDGQSTGVFPLRAHPGWLVKLYNRTADTEGTAALDGLITLTRHLPPPDVDLVRRHTCWPVARLADASGAGIGCVIPAAPPQYRVPVNGQARFLEMDFLAKPEAMFAMRGLVAPSYAGRLQVCRSLVAIGALLERHRLVYSDWSYSNAFWSPKELSAYVIDIDGCRRDRNHNINQPNWEDPLTAPNDVADGYTDRYRLALLVARCLTGRRDLPSVLHSVSELPNAAHAEILLDLLLATDRRRRPTLSLLEAVMSGLPCVKLPVPRRPLPPRPPDPPKPPRAAPAPNLKPVPTATAPQRSEVPKVAVLLFVLVIIVGLVFVLTALTNG